MENEKHFFKHIETIVDDQDAMLMDDLKAEIGTIVGCNSEVTDDTHNELCEQIYELVQRFALLLTER